MWEARLSQARDASAISAASPPAAPAPLLPDRLRALPPLGAGLVLVLLGEPWTWQQQWVAGQGLGFAGSAPAIMLFELRSQAPDHTCTQSAAPRHLGHATQAHVGRALYQVAGQQRAAGQQLAVQSSPGSRAAAAAGQTRQGSAPCSTPGCWRPRPAGAHPAVLPRPQLLPRQLALWQQLAWPPAPAQLPPEPWRRRQPPALREQGPRTRPCPGPRAAAAAPA